jgi:undecaprenyl pyrophosphate phosphatase UppP
MLAASSYDLCRRADLAPGTDGSLSFAVSFAVALFAIRWLLRFV